MTGRVTKDQKRALLDFIDIHWAELYGHATVDGQHTQEHLWDVLAERLNSMEEGGARRDAKGWKDTFNHMKTTFKIKLRNLRQSRHETGGGEILERHLLTPEDWLLEKFLRCAGDGHPQIGEIGVRGRTNVAFALQRPEDCDGTVQQSDAREVNHDRELEAEVPSQGRELPSNIRSSPLLPQNAENLVPPEPPAGEAPVPPEPRQRRTRNTRPQGNQRNDGLSVTNIGRALASSERLATAMERQADSVDNLVRGQTAMINIFAESLQELKNLITRRYSGNIAD